MRLVGLYLLLACCLLTVSAAPILPSLLPALTVPILCPIGYIHGVIQKVNKVLESRWEQCGEKGKWTDNKEETKEKEKNEEEKGLKLDW